MTALTCNQDVLRRVVTSIQQQNSQFNKQESQKKELKAVLSEPVESPEKRKVVKKSRFRFTDVNDTNYRANSKYFIYAYDQLNKMLERDSVLNLARAIYLVENALWANKLPYNKFMEKITSKANVARSYLRQQGVTTINSDLANYAVQKLFYDTIKIKQKNGKYKTYYPLKYDFKDYKGDEDIGQQTVSKLLMSGSGNCHSLPLLYEVLVSQLGGESFLAYSPEHSYIKFKNAKGNWYNFETTNGCLTTDAFVTGSGYVKSEALKSQVYTRPTNYKEVIAALYNDLAIYYQELYGYDGFQDMCAEQTLKYDPHNMQAYIIQSNYLTARTDLALANAGYPDPKTIPNYPEINTLFTQRNNLYEKIDNMGFSEMPKDVYQKWLATLKEELNKQESAKLKESLNLEINSEFKK